jgi:hypothetical protein
MANRWDELLRGTDYDNSRVVDHHWEGICESTQNLEQKTIIMKMLFEDHWAHSHEDDQWWIHYYNISMFINHSQ